MKKDIKNAKIAWDELGNINLDINDNIEQPWRHFEVGTYFIDLWYWIEEEYNVSIHELRGYPMNKIQVELDFVDTGNCRTYYRTIPNDELICLQDEGGGYSIWYTAIDDGRWCEPNYPIDMKLNEIEIVS